MALRRFLLIDRLAACGVGLIALLTYLLTLDPSASFWDCPEYIAVADKLMVGHPPGNPMWMLAARMMINFAPDLMHKALMVNMLSALTTALAAGVLFRVATLLFTGRWLGDEALRRRGIAKRRAFLSLSAAAVASLAFTWSDSVWFSAVEAEVYAFSLFLTVLTLWSVLLWGALTPRPGADRYLILAAYLTGAGMGVHELNLLILPTLMLIVGYRTRRPHHRPLRSWAFLGLGCLAVPLLLKGFLPLFIKISEMAELLAVNTLRWPFNSGLLLSWTTFFGLLLGGALLSRRLKKYRRRTEVALWSLLMFFIGCSCYALILIRASANPMLNTGAPDNIFSFRDYYERTQYGATPLLRGPVFSAPRLREQRTLPDGSKDYSRFRLSEPQRIYAKSSGAPPARLLGSSASAADCRRNQELARRGGDCYYVADYRCEAERVPEMVVWFPRMYSPSPDDVAGYKAWGGITDSNQTPILRPTLAVDSLGRPVSAPELQSGDTLLRPTLLQNLRYLGGYQIAYMYARYFWWNFAGRFNNLPGSGEPDAGLPATGIKAADRLFASTPAMPAEIAEENPGHNIYWGLPLLMGLLGACALPRAAFRRRPHKGRMASALIASLFFFAGVAIVLYLNQPPVQARDRDYSFLGSWMAFCLWIGAGVFPLSGWLALLCRRLKTRYIREISLLGGAAVALAVPLLMLSRTADDHNRSGRSSASDMGFNALSALPQGAILFVDTDNYSFPVCYSQATEHVRPDVRIVNGVYLSAPWYTSRLRLPQFAAPGLRLTLPQQQLATGNLAFVRLPAGGRWMPATEALSRIFTPADSPAGADRYLSLPTSRVYMVCHSDTLRLDLRKACGGKSLLPLNALVTLDIIASNLASPTPRAMAWDTDPASPFLSQLLPYMRRVGTLHLLDPARLSRHSAEENRSLHLRSLSLSEARDNARLAFTTFRWGQTEPGIRVYNDPLTAEMLSRFRIEMVKSAAVLSRYPAEHATALRLINLLSENMPAKSVPWAPYMLPDSTFTDEGAEIALALSRIASTAPAPRRAELQERARRLFEERLALACRYEAYRLSLPAAQREFMSNAPAGLAAAAPRLRRLAPRFRHM